MVFNRERTSHSVHVEGTFINLIDNSTVTSELDLEGFGVAVLMPKYTIQRDA